MRVENRFLKEDIEDLKSRTEHYRLKYDELHCFVLAVKFNSRVYKSKELSITAIETA